MIRFIVKVSWVAMTVALAWPAPPRIHGEPLPLSRIRLPRGFEIGIFASDVDGARSLALGPGGTVFVGTRGSGNVYALRDTDDDGRADSTYMIATGLNMPNGVACYRGDLYVAEISRVLRFDRIEKRLGEKIEPTVVRDDFPTDTHHGWKFIAFGPDGRLYIPIGAPCNVCVRDDARYASIMRMNADGSELELFASGVRNTVGFAWHPDTGELWFTDNGRDWLGDDLPPDELNRAWRQGLHFGFPFCHAGEIQDPKLAGGRTCDEFEPPVQKLGPHVAALGMRFYTGTAFGEGYRGQVFIAEHGSWNRSTPSGYRVSVVRLADGHAESYETFAEGWLLEDGPWGRPVDLLVMPDGALLVSDDYAGAIYRISAVAP